MKYVQKNFQKNAEVDIEELCFGLGTGSTALDADLDRQIRICNTACKTYRYRTYRAPILLRLILSRTTTQDCRKKWLVSQVLPGTVHPDLF
jgi:hypothetical protein